MADDGSIFQELESGVRSYCRRFTNVFVSGSGHEVKDEKGAVFLDFFSGAGALNYGHNDRRIKDALIAHLSRDGIIHSLDLHTDVKRDFLTAFRDVILAPRNLDYRVQFTGPTGANAVEAAIKLARRVTGRTSIAAFTNGYHGVSLGALAATGNQLHRQSSVPLLSHVVRMPYDGYLGDGVDTTVYIERLLDDPGSGIDLPAAFLLETVQGEGGLNVASSDWLRRLQAIAAARNVLLIVDDIQAGCGRAGAFFSFERAGIRPDIVCLSKSLSGSGLPMSVVLIRPELDCWKPGEHNGTFRGNCLAFAGAVAAFDHWRDTDFVASLAVKSRHVHERLAAIEQRFGSLLCRRSGLGMMQGLRFTDAGLAQAASEQAYQNGLLAETCGPFDEVLKLLPPLTIPADALDDGLDRIELAIGKVLAGHRPQTARGKGRHGTRPPRDREAPEPSGLWQ